MLLELLKGKIHRATVTQAELDYVGSITVDRTLLEQSGILEYEKVQIVDVNNGSRFETYTIAGEPNSGVICLNGAAARCVSVGGRHHHHGLRPAHPGGGPRPPAHCGLCGRGKSDQPGQPLRGSRPTVRPVISP